MLEIFYTLCTYPVLNVLMFLYHVVHDFGITILIFIFFGSLITSLLEKFVDIITRRLADQLDPSARSLGARLLVELVQVLSLLRFVLVIYLGYGIWSALFLLSTMTLSALNDVLYSFVPHFSTFPDLYLRWFTILQPGWFFSLVQPLPIPSWLIVVLLLVLLFIGGYMIIAKSSFLVGCLILVVGIIFVTSLATWEIPLGFFLFWIVVIAVMSPVMALLSYCYFSYKKV